MKTTFVSVVYDRKKRVNATGEGKVELYIHFSRREKKYVTIKTCNPIAWRKYQNSDELRLELAMYHQVAQKMYDTGELMPVCHPRTGWHMDGRHKAFFQPPKWVL